MFAAPPCETALARTRSYLEPQPQWRVPSPPPAAKAAGEIEIEHVDTGFRYRIDAGSVLESGEMFLHLELARASAGVERMAKMVQ
ncbi:MAG: hypothetical protein QNJ44_18025 [Rhodobacter sp.]|nr:hypothetical protein [Rhodobacter sp.]